MAVLWNRHRFSGGALVLDATNTVVLRGDTNRSFDRFDDAAEIVRFAEAASSFRSAELGGRSLCFDRSEDGIRQVMELREAADRLFRQAAVTARIHTVGLARMLSACAACLEGEDESLGGPDRPFGDPRRPMRFEAALAVSALSLISGLEWRRIRVCPNCNWLFVDRSRNASRLWCDMSVCGNRQKARRHYERRKVLGKDAANA
jgi:predicted RNA-binding Zn ribbon-like protein